MKLEERIKDNYQFKFVLLFYLGSVFMYFITNYLRGKLEWIDFIVLGAGTLISLIIVYYIVNNRSFKPIVGWKLVGILAPIMLLASSITGLILYFVLGKF